MGYSGDIGDSDLKNPSLSPFSLVQMLGLPPLSKGIGAAVRGLMAYLLFAAVNGIFMISHGEPMGYYPLD